MAESHPKSKLKRRRTAVDEHQADTWRRGSVQRSTVPFSSQDPTRDVKTDGSKPNKGAVSPPTLTWWTQHDLNPSEKLWAIALETVLPFLGPEVWDPLPKPSTVTPRQGERQRPFPANEVPPFPEASRPPGSPLQRPPPPLPVYSPAPPAGPLVTPPHGGGGGLQVPGTTAASGSVSPPHMRKEEDLEPPATHKVVQVGLVGRELVAEKTPQSRDPAERLIPPFPPVEWAHHHL
ncbi:hypothetical protein N1851_029446 [Merluccius polli]|uniref:Uncharacterized protein n=1 Tax=Merluccius polli TaxID=89951 RepID=A0AA47NRQ2_MERPO|nr:hypothetical protein N1851_029446 [Merluccius polli]